MKNLIVFDIAGTTIKDDNKVNASFVNAFNTFNIFPEKNQIDAVMGLSKPTAIEIILSGIKNPNQATKKEIHDQFLKEMINFYSKDENTIEIDGTSKTFQKLKNMGFIVTLDTGFSKDITDIIVDKLNWKRDGLVDDYICSDEVAQGRPMPYMIFRLMERFSIDSTTRVAKVGDTASDIYEGINAKCRHVVGVTSGTYTEEQFKKIKGVFNIVSDVTKIPDVVKGMM